MLLKLFKELGNAGFICNDLLLDKVLFGSLGLSLTLCNFQLRDAGLLRIFKNGVVQCELEIRIPS